MGTAALSERDYVHQAVGRAGLIISMRYNTVEKPPLHHARALSSLAFEPT
jgi:acetolactate synthase I/II/III large subunit